MRSFPRGKYMDERQRRSDSEGSRYHIRCPDCGGWIDFSDPGSSWITRGRFHSSNRSA